MRQTSAFLQLAVAALAMTFAVQLFAEQHFGAAAITLLFGFFCISALGFSGFQKTLVNPDVRFWFASAALSGGLLLVLLLIFAISSLIDGNIEQAQKLAMSFLGLLCVIWRYGREIVDEWRGKEREN